MKVLRKIIEIDEELCNGCGECIISCAEAALEIVDGKAKVIADKYCDGLGACLNHCPQGALRIIEREADDFDEEAVEALLAEKKNKTSPAAKPFDCGCAGSHVQSFQVATPFPQAKGPAFAPVAGETGSELTHWPVQIRLVPPTAPFLKGADLLVAADCTPVAYPHFHRDFLAGRVVMVGCPKFDEAQAYIRKFTEIFQVAKPRSVTVVIMEVPCCGGMRQIVSEALRLSGEKIAVEEAVIGARGQLIRREKW